MPTRVEREETLEFVDKCDKHFNLGVVWIEADIKSGKGNGTDFKVVDFKTASRKGEPFKELIKKYGLPSKLYRHCTRELKETPLRKYAHKYFGHKKWQIALGIRADEPHRVNRNRKNTLYPLADINVDEKFIRTWWDKQPFERVYDKHDMRKTQCEFDYDLDVEFDCFCKNT